jgi:nucleoside-diphosphate-sugar epimerase
MHGDSRPETRKEHPLKVLKNYSLETLFLIEFARKKQTQKYVLISSNMVNGDVSNKDILTEKDYGYIDYDRLSSASFPLANIYAEALVRAENIETGLNVSIIRKTGGFGISYTPEHGGVMAESLNSVIHNEDIIIHGNGLQKRSYTYNADFASAILYVLFKGKPKEAYNAANPANFVSIKELANLINEIAGNKVKVIIENKNTSSEYQDMSINLSIDKIKELGWKAKYSLKNGITRMLAQYQE